MQALGPQQVYDEVDAVDVLTIGCGTDPVPACEVDDYRVYADYGYYAGALRITEALKDD